MTASRIALRIGTDRGFTLVELMVAMTLGLLVAVGLVSLFGVTSKTNKVQDGLAQLQENGRYAIKRFNGDLRLAGRQVISTSGAPSAPNATNGAAYPPLAAKVYVASIPFPDGAIGPPAGWPAATPWPLSPRYFMQGYECSSGSCLPAEPSTALVPASSSTPTANLRLAKTDVLVERFINNNQEGWSQLIGDITINCNSGNLTSITLTPQTAGPNKSLASNFVDGDLALMYMGFIPQIFQVGVSGTTLTPKNVYGGGFVGNCSNTGEALLFNFSRDFQTIAYWLRFDADPNISGRFIPTLVRTVMDNVGTPKADQALVQGVERMDFLYGVQYADASTTYLTADNVTSATYSNATNCTPAPTNVNPGVANPLETGCLWRSLQTTEVHLLIDSVNDQFDLSSSDQIYQYMGSTLSAPASKSTVMPNGLPAGAMMRREFAALVSMRNSI